MSHSHHSSTLRRIVAIRRLTDALYEPGTHARCYAAIWRSHIRPLYGICYRTYLNYLRTPSFATNDKTPSNNE